MEKIETMALGKLKEHPDNPRTVFDLEDIEASIKEKGILQPLIVRAKGKDAQILSGARRFRAAQKADLKEIPVIVRDYDDEQAFEFMINANLQTTPGPLDEAATYDKLRKKGYTLARMAASTGRSERWVYDRLGLLNLVLAARKLLYSDKITTAHAILLSRLTPLQQATVLDTTGALFESESGYQGGLDGIDRGDGTKPRSTREFKAWIDDHFRFDKKEPDAMLFPETKQAVTQAEEAKEKIVQVTHNHFTQPSAKEGNAERIYHGTSWKRADGSSKANRPCDKSVTGVVVVGPERGAAFKVCVNKNCDVHWKQERTLRQHQKKALEEYRDGNRDAVEKAKREQEREEKQRQLWQNASQTIIDECAAKIGKASFKVLKRVLAEYTEVASEKFKANNADGLIRVLAFHALANAAGFYWRAKEFSRVAKLIGVDVKAILEKTAEEKK